MCVLGDLVAHLMFIKYIHTFSGVKCPIHDLTGVAYAQRSDTATCSGDGSYIIRLIRPPVYIIIYYTFARFSIYSRQRVSCSACVNNSLPQHGSDTHCMRYGIVHNIYAAGATGQILHRRRRGGRVKKFIIVVNVYTRQLQYTIFPRFYTLCSLRDTYI